MQNPVCIKCRDDGFYFRVPSGRNPFAASIEVTVRNMRKVVCDCDAGRAYKENPGKPLTARVFGR